MTPLDRFWTGVLALLAPIITPDWGALIALLPLGLLLLVLGYLALLARRWAGVLLAEPTRGRRRHSWKPVILTHVGVMAVGVMVTALSFVAGSRDPSWDGAQSPFGLVINLPLLLLGVLLTVGAAGNGARIWERNSADGSETSEPDAVDQLGVWVREHRALVRRLLMFFGGALIAALGLTIRPAADPATGVQPVATFPVLLVGLALSITAVGSAIAAAWPADPDFDGAPAARGGGDHA